MYLAGSEWLVRILHIVSQCFLVPVIIALLAFFAHALLELGMLAAESRSRRRVTSAQIGELMQAMQATGDVRRALEGPYLSGGHKEVLARFLALGHLGSASRRAYARRLLEEEEHKRARSLDRTEMVVKLGPALGLMGTLIPLGPGLAALSSGDVRGLAQAVIIAFDTTVVGLAAGGVAFLVSRVRRRWYDDYMSTLETATEGILEVLEDAEKEKVLAGWRGGS